MRHDARAGTTGAVPLGYYLRAIIAGDDSIPGLAEVAAESPLWAQYDPDAPDWVARPDLLAETNLVLVFTPEDERGEAVPIRSREQRELWMHVLARTELYSDEGEEVGAAEPGTWYRVLRQEDGWVLVIPESSDAPQLWLVLDDRLDALIE
jgi:hypothetical protein